MSVPKVRDLMKDHPITLRPRDKLTDAEYWMQQRRIRHMPVSDGERLVGLISQRDVLAAKVSSVDDATRVAKYATEEAIRVSDVMTRAVETVAPDDSALAAAKRMRELKVDCLPVVDAKRLIGILTVTDFLELAITLMQDS